MWKRGARTEPVLVYMSWGVIGACGKGVTWLTKCNGESRWGCRVRPSHPQTAPNQPKLPKSRRMPTTPTPHSPGSKCHHACTHHTQSQATHMPLPTLAHMHGGGGAPKLAPLRGDSDCQPTRGWCREGAPPMHESWCQSWHARMHSEVLPMHACPWMPATRHHA